MTSFPLAVRAPGATAPSASPILTQIRDLIYRVAGIFQANNKLGLLQERCHKRMQVLGIASLRDYYECLTVKPMRQAELSRAAGRHPENRPAKNHRSKIQAFPAATANLERGVLHGRRTLHALHDLA